MSRKTKQSVLRSKLEEMMASIRDSIRSGAFKNGQFLPSELELAEQYNLSKHSVRKGLDILVTEGYVQKIPRIGNKVLNPDYTSNTTIRFGYYPSMHKQAELSTLIDYFHERHPGIQVELIPIPFHFDDLQLMKHYLQSGLIDVAMFNNQSFSEFHERDGSFALLEPLQPPEDTYPFLLPAFQDGKRLRAVPFVFSPVILCYNKDHFEEFDLPEPDSSWTWNELMDVAHQITNRSNRVGFYYHALSDNRWPIFLLQSGQWIRPEDTGPVSFRHPDVREAIQMSRDIISHQGLSSFLSQSDLEADDLFRQGKVSMVMTTYFVLNEFRNASFRFDIAPLPQLKTSRTLNLVIGLAVSAKSANKEAAKTLVHYLTSQEAQTVIRHRTLSIPAMKRAAERTGRTDIRDAVAGRGKRSPSPAAQGARMVQPFEAAEPSRFQLYREIIPSFKMHSELGLSGPLLKQIREELKLYWSQVTDLDTCCRHLEKLLSEQPVVNA